VHPGPAHRRGPPAAPRRARPPAHPGQLRVGLYSLALTHPRRPARDPTTAHPRQKPLALVPHPHPPLPRRCHPVQPGYPMAIAFCNPDRASPTMPITQAASIAIIQRARQQLGQAA
jgi:hypothetical protein